ncbi:hypothetical protein OE88DRAFT_1739863 [Heliocybe sulcata]|uniref:F-box domain-containing protein n=1 Tax=Heliocybe sulcata TaxID=5364 RepID=A0A5C3MKI3_9AGAM|nr:hypothetical protein OE88DRAFT_1739863 [Heliocybe sulcata]
MHIHAAPDQPQHRTSGWITLEPILDNTNSDLVSTTHAREEIAKELLHGSHSVLHEFHIAEVRTVNGSRPLQSCISTLPTELLVHIFCLYLVDAVWSGTPGNQLWAVVLLVCRDWRDIIKHNPSLWATIPLNDTPLAVVKAALANSKARALSICGKLEGCDAGEKLKLVLQASVRIRALNLDLESIHLLRILEETVGDGMPQLTELVLHAPKTVNDPPPFHMNIKHFASQRLMKLDVHDLSFQSFYPLLCDSITDLTLTQCIELS